MVPYGLGQKVEFKKNFGPKLGELNIDKMKDIDEVNFTHTLDSVYKAISITSNNELLKNRDMIGFAGAPWTILVYMMNKMSPKKKLSDKSFNDDFLVNKFELQEILKKSNNNIKIFFTIIIN